VTCRDWCTTAQCSHRCGDVTGPQVALYWLSVLNHALVCSNCLLGIRL
jgi:hypothetical protein